MSKVVIKQEGGGTRVFIDGKEIEDVKECTLNLKANYKEPTVKLEILVTEGYVEQEIKKGNIIITRD